MLRPNAPLPWSDPAVARRIRTEEHRPLPRSPKAMRSASDFSESAAVARVRGHLRPGWIRPPPAELHWIRPDTCWIMLLRAVVAVKARGDPHPGKIRETRAVAAPEIGDR